MPPPLPVEPAQGEVLVNLCKAHPEALVPQNWSADPEQACIRHGAFLQLLLKESLTKAQVQHIFTAASKKLEKSESKMIAGCVMETKKWVVKKFQNMKTGAKTNPKVLQLMHAVFGTKTHERKEPAEGQTASKAPGRRIHGKSPQPKGKPSEPVQALVFVSPPAGSSLAGEPAAVQESCYEISSDESLLCGYSASSGSPLILADAMVEPRQRA